MKLKIFEPTNEEAPRLRLAAAGTISLNQGVINVLKAKVGDKLIIAQDTENPKDWYMAVSKSDKGMPLKGNQEKRVYTIQSKELVNQILTSNSKPDDIGYYVNVASTSVEVDGESYFAILTLSLKPSKR